MFGLESIKKLLVEKWLGRIIALALAAAGGFLMSLGVEQALVSSWVAATEDLLTALAPIIISIILDQIQHRVALNTQPPAK